MHAHERGLLLRRDAPMQARVRVSQLKEALADAKAQVVEEIRELQAAQAELEKATYDKDNKARAALLPCVSLSTLPWPLPMYCPSCSVAPEQNLVPPHQNSCMRCLCAMTLTACMHACGSGAFISAVL
jgi:hypothetical protein